MIDWNWPSCWIKLGQLSANLPGGRAADIRSSYIVSIFENSPATSWRIIFCAAAAVEEESSGASACGCPAGAGVCADAENVGNRKTSTTKTVLFNKESPCGCIFPRSKSIQETPSSYGNLVRGSTAPACASRKLAEKHGEPPVAIPLRAVQKCWWPESECRRSRRKTRW